ncbi:MAG: hypothetical protein IJX46_00990 [Clostridia bacterium]|nr:hypothetical protein [Clostridia bacterium]
MSSNRALRITGRVIKYLVIAAIFAVCIFMIWRAFFSDILPDSMNNLVINDSNRAAFAQNGGDLRILYQEQITVSSADHNRGYFGIVKVDILPEANQIQLVFRYNNSTLSAVANDKGLSSVPSRDADIFDVSIVLSEDLTPEDSSDNAFNDEQHPDSVKQTRYFPTASFTVKEQKNMYNYRKLVFDNVPVENIDKDKLILALYVDIYYDGDEDGVVDYSESSYGTLCIWDYKSQIRTRELTGADKKALAKK